MPQATTVQASDQAPTEWQGILAWVWIVQREITTDEDVFQFDDCFEEKCKKQQTIEAEQQLRN